MLHKTIIKLVPIITLTSAAAVVALAQVRALQPQGQQSSGRFDFAATSWHKRTPEDEKFEKSFAAAYNRSNAVVAQARQLLKARRFEEAKQACARALALSPKGNGEPTNMSAYQLLGDINQEQGHYQEAISAYLKTREHTYDTELDLNIALTYLKMDDITNAHKFYDEEKFFTSRMKLSPTEKADYMARFPGTKTAKTMEASIYLARGCEESASEQLEEAIADYKKVLVIAPHNAMAAYNISLDLDRLEDSDKIGSNAAIPYLARAAVFGKGEIVSDAQRRLHDRLMPDKVQPALDEARKIEE